MPPASTPQHNTLHPPTKRVGAWSNTRSLLLIILLTCALLPPSEPDPNDELCLTRLSESLQDPLKNLQNWSKATFGNSCQGFTPILQGVTCNNGRIYKLSLSNLSLKGSISPNISSCTNLQALDLLSNAISGPIPPDLQYLVNLAVLNLSSNRLSSPIPQQLTLCAYLNVIDRHANQLSGLIPQKLGLPARLSIFDVSNNKLSGPIPSSLGNRSGNLPRFNASSYERNKDLYGYPLPPMRSKQQRAFGSSHCGDRIGKWVVESGAELYSYLRMVENFGAENGY